MDEDYLYNFCSSPFWDNNLTWYTDSPKFTPCFEKTILVWIPCAFLWLFSPIDVYYIFTSKTKNIPWNWRNKSKVVAYALLIAVCISDLFYHVFSRIEVFPVDIYTPIIKIVSLVFCLSLVLLHRMYGQRSSGLLFIFWFLVALFGFSQFYRDIEAQLLSVKLEEIKILYIAYYCLSLGLFMLEWITDLPPSSSEYPPIKNSCPEESASFPSRLMFSWFDHLLHQGFKRTLTSSDLWPMKHQYTASQVFLVFDKYWKATLIKNNGIDIEQSAKFLKNGSGINISRNGIKAYKPTSIVLPLCKAFGPAFLVCSVLKLMQIFLSFISPELLKYLIIFIEGDEPKWHGYLYATSLFIFSTLQVIFMTQYAHIAQITGLRVKTALTMAIYRKALKLSNASRKESTLGEIVNLMAVDAHRFYQLITSLNNLWSFPVQITLAVVLLWQGLGPSVLAGFAILVIMIPINGYIVNRARGLQIKQMKYKDERIKIMNEIISGIKVLKLYAWEPSFEERVLKIRKKEADLLKKAAYLKAVISFIWACAPFLVSLVTFTTYVLIDESNVLDTSKAFVSLALFNILRPPLTILPMVISNVMQAGVSVKRINKFLNSEELDPNGVTLDDKDDKDALVVEDGSFSWGPSEEPTLHDLNLRVPCGSLVAVVGAVGSGKSSLISAFLGGMYKLSGKISMQGNLAYVSQLTWIQNCTLQDNVLFGKNLDKKRYCEVIDACALKQDLEMLPGGDQTEIGERGINLSGGQKQRVSLARAIYSDCDVYLLDDPLSAVDSHVGKHIFEDVISSRGILRRKTRLLVTHNTTYLPDVDLIVVLKNGTISEVGTYRELLGKKGAFSEFLLNYLHENDSEELGDNDIKMTEHILRGDPEFSRQKSVSSSSSATSLRQRGISSNSSNHEEKKDKDPQLIKEERSEVGKVKWTVYSNYLRAIGFCMFSASIILTVFRQVFSVGSNIWLSEWSSDKTLVINGTQDTNKRNMYLEVYGLLGAGETVTTFFSSILWFLGTTNAGTFLHFILLINIMRCPMSFFDATPQGRIISRFAKDIDIIDNIIPSSMKQLISFVSSEIGTLLVISYSTPVFVAVMIPIGFLYYLIQRYYVATSQQLKRLESVSRSPVYSHFGETVTGSAVIRAFNAQERFIKESEEKIDFNQVCSYPSIVASRWLTIRLQMLGNLAVFFCTLFSVISKDSVSPGIVAISITYALQITQSLTQLANSSAEVETNIVAVERIKEYAELPQEAAWEITPSPVGSNWPQEGKIEFKDYSLRYREGLSLVLNRINLVINGGEKIGIVGRTGAGKSSITLGLFRVIESAGGKILIDGIDILKLGLHSLRSRFAIIPQDPVLFSGSLRMNLDPFGYYSDEQVWRALELTHLKPFVKGLPAGLQYEVAEGGENISVGQRQLVCLARAILRKTKILILDEATSAVDLETDDFIQNTIRIEFADCTVLTIAHRINTIMDSDRILVLDKGSVVEFDTPGALLKNKASAFCQMAHDAGLV